jgi:hypothetical protein
MRSLVVTAVAATVCFGIPFVFPFGTASAKDIENTSYSCKGKAQLMQQNGLYGCTGQPLKVRPLGSGGGGVNPNDYGMCGVLGVSGLAAETNEARIIIDNGYYVPQVASNNPSLTPTLDVTCVYFKAFKGLPSISDGSFLSPPSFKNGSSVGDKDIASSAGKACIWAGFTGELKAPLAPQTAGGSASAMYANPETKIESSNATSYAFCSGYTATTWTGWQYVIKSPAYYNIAGTTKINENDYWCYMDGIETQFDISNAGGPLPTTIDAGLKISFTNVYSTIGIYTTGHHSVGMGFNCLPLQQ